MNFGELKTLINKFGHRTDLTDNIPDFVALTEEKIAKTVRAIEFITMVTLGESDRISGSVYNLPTDFLGMRALTGTNNGQSYQLRSVSFSELNRFGSTGIAQIFTIYGKKIEFRATPSTDTNFTLIYFARPAALADDSDTNELLTAYSDIYLNGALAQLHAFTQDLELGSVWDDLFLREVESVNSLAEEIRGTSATGSAFNFSGGSTM